MISWRVARMGHVERVAAPGVVHAVARAVRHQPVVGGVVDAAEGQGRPQVIALRRVVVHDVEDDLDARLVKGLDHGLELGDLLARAVGGGEPRVGGEKSDRVVSPVVREPAFHQIPVGDRIVHGQELDRGDAELAQVFESGRRGQARVGAAEGTGHVGMAGGEALDVELVDHRLVPWRPGTPVVAPAEGRIDGHGSGYIGRAVPVVSREILVRVAHRVAEERIVPLERPRDRLGVRVEEQAWPD